jgi:hypothetical protein
MTDLIEVQTSELTGAALDWAVAQVEGIKVATAEPHYGADWRVYRPESGGKYSPSTEWAVGGPLIERETLHLFSKTSSQPWTATNAGGFVGFGSTPLVAACRAIVAAKLGYTVQVPRELIQ